VAFDLPTQMGLDSDDPGAEGEVGRVGMAVDSLRDFEVAFEGIPLDRIGVGLTINAVASIMLAMFQATAEKFGYAKDRITCHSPERYPQRDGRPRSMDLPGEPAVRLIGDTIEYAMKELPRTNPVSVCGYHIRESGCSPAQEIAYAFQIAMPTSKKSAQEDIRSMILSGVSPSTLMSSATSGSRLPSSEQRESCGRRT